MDVAGHDLLPGPRLSRDQYRGVGRRDFRRIDEHTLPLRGLTKGTMRTATFQFLHERAHPLLKHAGALLCTGYTAGFLGQPLVG